MRSTVKVFGYKDLKQNVTVRRVFVMHQNDEYIQGFDMDVLTNSERNWILQNLKDHEVKSVYTNGYSDTRRLQNIDEDKIKHLIAKSWKTFKTGSSAEPYLTNNLQFLLTKDQLVDFISTTVPAKKSSIRRNINAAISGRSGKSKRYTAYGYKIAKIVTGFGIIPKEI